LGALDFKVASWGLMKPGIAAGVAPSIERVFVRLTVTLLKNASTHETAPYWHFQ
jgi:hypothetical protein